MKSESRESSKKEGSTPWPDGWSAEDVFRQVAEHSGEIVFFTDVTGEILYVNPIFEETYGIRAEAAVGRTPGVLEAGFQDSSVFQPFWSALLNGKTVREETVHRARDGTSVHVESEVYPLRDESEIILGFLAIQRDLTERRELEAALEENEARFQTLLEKVPQGIGFLNREGQITHANPALARLLGTTPADLQGAMFQDFLPMEERNAFQHRMDTVAGGVTDPSGEYHLAGPSDTLVPVSASSRMVQMGGRFAVLLTVQDLTEVKRLERRLRALQRLEAVGRLAGGVAHELNDLLTVIQTHSELLMGAEEAWSEMEEEGKAGLREVFKGVERGRRLAYRLMALTEGGDLSFVNLEVDRVLLGLRPTLQRLLPADVSLELFVPDGLPPIRADHASVEQIVLDLTTQARDVLPEGGALSIRLTRSRFPESNFVDEGGRISGEFLCLTFVSRRSREAPDTGPSSAPGLSAPDSGEKGRPPGLGAVRGLVEAHGGMVNLYSGPGDGSTVQVHLPVAAPDDEDGPADREGDGPTTAHGAGAAPDGDHWVGPMVEPGEAPASPAAPGRGETILLVEDDPALRKATRRALEMAGYRVLTARDGQAGLEMLRELGDEVDLVLTDLIMPRMGGRRLYHAARREGKRTPFLFASGYGTERGAVREDSEVSVPFLSKPWTVRELTGMVRELLDEKPET